MSRRRPTRAWLASSGNHNRPPNGGRAGTTTRSPFCRPRKPRLHSSKHTETAHTGLRTPVFGKLPPHLCTVRYMTTTNDTQPSVLPAHWEHVSRFRKDEPIEIRFHGRGDRYWQLLASVTPNGVVHYRLESNPRGNYSYSLSYLVGDVDMSLPMKAYQGWQSDVLAWLVSHTSTKGSVYFVDDVL